MTSGAMLTALAIFAAVWIQAGYLWKLRLKLARGRPLGTSTVVVVALTLVVEAARWTERKGLTGDWTGTAELGATVGVAVCIVWTVLAISTKVQFRTANAKRFEEATYDTIKEGKESDLRTLAKEMAGTPVRRMVASAKDVGYGERHGKQQHETRWSALRTLNQMSDPGMMKAICKEKGDVVADLVDETSKSKGEDRREWYSGEERGMGYLLETEERIVGAMATEAVQKDCPLLDEAETLWGPRGNKYHPTQMRWDDTILDKVWGNPDLVRRSERRFWNFWRWGVGEHVDQAKVRRIVLAVTDTILALPPNPEWRWTEPHYGLGQVLLKAVREGENKEGEKTGETGWFLKELARMINKREERERTKQTDNTWNQASILVQPEGYTESIAEIMLMFMRWSTGAEGMAAWNRWLGVRCADAMWFREIEDRDWIPTVQRQLVCCRTNSLNYIPIDDSAPIRPRARPILARISSPVACHR